MTFLPHTPSHSLARLLEGGAMSAYEGSRMPPLDSMELVQGEGTPPTLVLQDVAAMEPSQVRIKDGLGHVGRYDIIYISPHHVAAPHREKT